MAVPDCCCRVRKKSTAGEMLLDSRPARRFGGDWILNVQQMRLTTTYEAKPTNPTRKRGIERVIHLVLARRADTMLLIAKMSRLERNWVRSRSERRYCGLPTANAHRSIETQFQLGGQRGRYILSQKDPALETMGHRLRGGFFL